MKGGEGEAAKRGFKAGADHAQAMRARDRQNLERTLLNLYQAGEILVSIAKLCLGEAPREGREAQSGAK
jgi:hypothetical protein